MLLSDSIDRLFDLLVTRILFDCRFSLFSPIVLNAILQITINWFGLNKELRLILGLWKLVETKISRVTSANESLVIQIDLANNTRYIMTNFQFHTTLLLLCVSSCVYLDILPVEAESILIRPYYVYKNLIKGVHDYFNNTCIILFHGSSKLIEEEGECIGDYWR